MTVETTLKIGKLELINDIIFYDKDNKPMLTLKSDGKIIVDGEPNEAAKTFLETLEREYGTLPRRLDEAKAEIVSLKAQLKEGTEDGSRCNRRCEGVMVLGMPENCSCHISAPCGPCEDIRPVCSMCGEEVE